MVISGAGLTIDLPPGWEGEIRAAATRPDGSQRYSLTHLANFPIPAGRGVYGSGAVEAMTNGDVWMAMLEFDPASANTPLFSGPQPRSLRASDFGRDSLQHPVAGQGGCQRFFTVSGRPFCLYVVVGDYIDRVEVLPQIDRVLTGITVS